MKARPHQRAAVLCQDEGPRSAPPLPFQPSVAYLPCEGNGRPRSCSSYQRLLRLTHDGFSRVGFADSMDAGGFAPCLLRWAGSRHANQNRRLLSLAAVLDGMDREQAARIGRRDRQTLRDWVHRFNEHGPRGRRISARRAIRLGFRLINSPPWRPSSRTAPTAPSMAWYAGASSI